MIKIEKADKYDLEVLALLSRLTYIESHGPFIEDKNDMVAYVNKAFSVSNIRQDLNDSRIIFYIIYVDELPVGYSKLILNAKHESVVSANNCRLDRIYVLAEFIPMRIGKHLITHTENEAMSLYFDTIWLSVYVKNYRAIRFYEKNEYKKVGQLNFMVNGKIFDNDVLSKKLLA